MSKKHAVETIERLRDERDRLREALESVVHTCEIGGAMTGQVGCIHRTATAALCLAEEGGAP